MPKQGGESRDNGARSERGDVQTCGVNNARRVPNCPFVPPIFWEDECAAEGARGWQLFLLSTGKPSALCVL